MGIQVYTATHGGEGQPLSNLEKAFISFEFGGKKIEDFNFLSVTPGDRLHRGISAPYSDITSEQEGMDGQLWWGGEYEPLVLDFTLATDGVTARELNEFSAYFKPGIKRELVLSEHPNRAIEARVASIPEYDFLPFEEVKKISLGGKEKELITTIYKGELTISFICDYPFWHAIESDFTGISVEEATDQQINIAVEDGILLKEMLPRVFDYGWLYLADSKFKIGQDASVSKYLYYCGTAPAYPKISFTKPIVIKDNRIELDNSKNYISIGSEKLQYGLPSVFSAVNTCIDIIDKYEEGDSHIDLQRDLRENVYHYAVRAAAVRIVNSWTNNYINLTDSTLKTGFAANFKESLLNYVPSSYKVYIDCAIGETTIDYTFNEVSISNEKAGDMIKSNYLKIDKTASLSSNGTVSLDECCQVSVSEGVVRDSLKIDYQYMYV